ncbi:hypothetical protein jhhlp_008331 [Lomentospora prolificans]|uniref:Uncharacterized protein n=1 Tax=Lomentospora prolificans TaxID=41688 RepID=A0A2N3MXR8_9PEZI|nr:hypothetical protein jhhlp_008331 [Lomentospora prolificans]
MTLDPRQSRALQLPKEVVKVSEMPKSSNTLNPDGPITGDNGGPTNSPGDANGGPETLPGSGSKPTAAIAAGVTVAAIVLLLLIIFLFRYRRTKKNNTMSAYGRRDRALFAIGLKKTPGRRSSTVMGGLLINTGAAGSPPNSPTFVPAQPAMVERPTAVAQRRFSARSDETGVTLPSPTSTVFGGTISMFPLPPSQHSLPQSTRQLPITPTAAAPAVRGHNPRNSVGGISQLSRPSEIRVSFSDVSGFSDTTSNYDYNAGSYATHPTYQPDAPPPGPPRLNSIRRHTDLGDWNQAGSGGFTLSQAPPRRN